MVVESAQDATHSKAMPDLIEKMLAERQEMLVLFNRLAELKPFTEIAPVQSVLQRFCQVLVDYAALGHFEVYQCIEEGADDSGHKESFRRTKQVAEELYPGIAATTQAALNFNDRYDCEEHCEVLDSLCEDLSQLGEQLALRIEMEDRLIAAMRESCVACAQSAPS